MAVEVEIQHAVGEEVLIPADNDFRRWAEVVLNHQRQAGSVVIRVVEESESHQLNELYRHKSKPTNVLSFPFEAPEFVADEHLGDLVICASVVNREAQQQQKPSEAHWAHMVVHGILHLLGYDHVTPEQAQQMEPLEVSILEQLGINNPYEVKT